MSGGEEGNDASPSPPPAEAQDLAKLLETCVADIEELRRKQELMISKQDGADSVRRGQLDCISERIYQAEKNIRQAEERQHDAIEKASATFQKHACDVEQERQNLMCVIGQVNQNFEHISNEIAQHGFSISALEQNIAQLQGSVSQGSVDSRNSVIALHNDLGVLQQDLQQHRQQSGDIHLLEHAIKLQQQQMTDVQATLTALHDAVLHQAEAEVLQRGLVEKLAEMEAFIRDSKGQQMALVGQFNDMRVQVADLSDAVTQGLLLQDGLLEGQQLPGSRKVAHTASGSRRPGPAATLPVQGERLPLTPPAPPANPRQRHDIGTPQGQEALHHLLGNAHARELVAGLASMTSPSRANHQQDIGNSSSPGRSARLIAETIRHADPFFDAVDLLQGSREGRYPPAPGMWDRFESVPVADLVDSAHSAGQSDGEEVVNTFVFDMPTQDGLHRGLPRASRGPDRPRVPEPSAVPAPVMGWEGSVVGM